MSDGKNKGVQHKTSVGGQALIEGIMMRGPQGAAMSVRLPDGTIDTEYKDYKQIKDKVKFLGWPIIRGVVSFIESMVFGYKCLMESAEKSGLDTEDVKEEEMSKLDRWISDHFGPKMMAVISAVAMVLGLLLAFALFFYLPSLIFDGINTLAKGGLLSFKGLIEGTMRILIFIAYIALVSQMKDIKRVFSYHGAEHKTIFCYEHGEELTVENVRKQIRFHPRCGTSFIFVILIISILVASLLILIFPELGNPENRILWMCIKILTLPVTMGFGYEFIRYAGRHENWLTKTLSAPGLWMQRLTTKEPDDSMIEVGIAAFKAVITDNPEDDAI